MESERPWARAAIMREAVQPRGRAERRARLAGLADRLRRPRDHRRRHARARAPHPRRRRDARRRVRRRASPRREAARADRRRAADGRAGPRRRRHARATSAATASGDGPADRGDRHRHQGLDGARARRARRARVAAPVHRRAPRSCSPRTPTRSSSPTARATRRRSDYVVETVRELVGAQARVGHLPRPPAAVPRGRPGDLQAAVRPSRRQPSGQGPADRHASRSPPRTTASPRSAPAARARSTPTSRCAGRPTSAPPRSRT